MSVSIGQSASIGNLPPVATLAAFPAMLERDRKREGLRVCRAAWLVCVSVREYREIEAGERSPTFETWDRICKLYGWPQTFVGLRTLHHHRARCAGVAPPEQSHGHQRQHQRPHDEQQDVREVSVQS